MALRIYKHHSEGGKYDKGRGWEGGQKILLNIYAFLVTIYLVIASHSFVLRKISIPEIWVDRKLKGHVNFDQKHYWNHGPPGV